MQAGSRYTSRFFAEPLHHQEVQAQEFYSGYSHTQQEEGPEATISLAEGAARPRPPPPPSINRFRYALPPSPPLTNPHFKRAIPLPFVADQGRDRIEDAHKLHMNFSIPPSPQEARACEYPEDGAKIYCSSLQGQMGVCAGPRTTPALPLSPPYSPKRRVQTLLSVEECAVEEKAEASLRISVSEIDATGMEFPAHQAACYEWQAEVATPGAEEDEWDDPLFLNAPSRHAQQDKEGLDLNLFGGIGQLSQDYLRAPPSPTIQSASLPGLENYAVHEGDMEEKEKPLFDPSDFDVFENGWDTMLSPMSTHSTTSSSSDGQPGDHEDQDLLQFDFGNDFSFGDPVQCRAHPASPSRRSIVDLPREGLDEREHPPRPSSRLSFHDAAPVETGSYDSDKSGSHILYSRFSPTHICRTSPPRHTFDVPSEIFQSPFNIPLLLAPPASPADSKRSLLFAPAEPQEVSLLDPPAPPQAGGFALLSPDVLSDDENDGTVPPHMLEESQLRALHHQTLAVETHARNREAVLTEYISRLNAMRPPSENSSSPVYYSVPLISMSMGASSPASQPGPGPATLNFLQARRREVQHAVALRAAERRKRKGAKERARELDALLQLKSIQLRADALSSLRSRSRSRARGEPEEDDTIVLAASGSDRHLAHTGDILSEGEDMKEDMSYDDAERGRQEIRQLVAKMIFRRRDSPRPLTGKAAAIPARPYIRSTLSQAMHNTMADEMERLSVADENKEHELTRPG